MHILQIYVTHVHMYIWCLWIVVRIQISPDSPIVVVIIIISRPGSSSLRHTR